MYIWVNSHGSFPLGILALLLLWAGRRLDKEDGTTEWRCLKWASLGVPIAGLNPYGPKLLIFPVYLLAAQRHPPAHPRVASARVHWTSGRSSSSSRSRRGPRARAQRRGWRVALPFVVFVPAALYSSRNILVASLVLTAADRPRA